jgi:RNA polymerase sigma-70 factor (ECF subfamily)
MENKECILAARNGDKHAMTQLLMEYRNLVSSVVCRTVFEKDNRKDIIQNVFFKVVKAIHEFNGTCKFSTWLYRISINEVAEYNRSLLRSKETFQSIETDEDIFQDINSTDGLEAYTKKEISISINTAVNELPLEQKTAFSLFYFCGYSGKDAAQVLNVTEDNFFMKLKAARDKVRKALVSKGWKL